MIWKLLMLLVVNLLEVHILDVLIVAIISDEFFKEQMIGTLQRKQWMTTNLI